MEPGLRISIGFRLACNENGECDHVEKDETIKALKKKLKKLKAEVAKLKSASKSESKVAK